LGYEIVMRQNALELSIRYRSKRDCDERTQLDAYLSRVILAESVGALRGNFVRDRS
jgi:hypothetical protein